VITRAALAARLGRAFDISETIVRLEGLMPLQPATNAQIRKHFTDAGFDVRIHADGHILHRKTGSAEWLNGRFTCEYFWDGKQVVIA
jgi:hypothetical protein